MDKRFVKAGIDPRFRKVDDRKQKVKVDDRFKKMFKSKDFQTAVQVDKYGRKAANKKEDLERFYDLESDEEGDEEQSSEEEDEESEEEKAVPRKKKAKDKKASEEEVDDDEEESSDEQHLSDMEGEDLLARARGEVEMYSSDEESEEEEEEEEEEPQEEVEYGDATTVLGAFNMDWDQVDSTDILAVLQSFVPAGGAIESVEVYTTIEGAKTIEKEKTQGPQGLFQEEDDEEEERRLAKLAAGEVVEDDGEEFDQEKLRRYQKNKMTFHVAIVRCDSVETAVTLYSQCDGIEFERSSNMLDLRYVHDTFFAKLVDTPRDTSNDIPADYEAPMFATSALQQTKVDLAWDNEDPRRSRLTMRDFSKGELCEDDYRTYLASESEEDEEDSKVGSSLRSLLGNDDEEEDEEEPMEITWNVGLDAAAKGIVKKVQEKKDSKGEEEEEEGVYDKYLRERAEKKSAKRKEQRLERKKAKNGTQEEAEPEEEEAGDSKANVWNDPFFTQGPTKLKKKKKAAAEKLSAQQKEEEDKQKAELELLVMDEQDDGRGYDMKELVAAGEKKKKKTTSKRKLKRSKKKDEEEVVVEDTFEVDTTDDRFGALQAKDFHIDPTSTQYKKTAAMKKLQEAVTKNTKDSSGNKKDAKKKKKAKGEQSTESLVASVKRGAKEHEQRKKKKIKLEDLKH